MMFWNGGAMGSWGFVLMTLTALGFWALVIAGLIVLVRHLRGPGTQAPQQPTAEQVLRQRLAQGEISEEEYRARLNLLRETSQAGLP